VVGAQGNCEPGAGGAQLNALRRWAGRSNVPQAEPRKGECGVKEKTAAVPMFVEPGHFYSPVTHPREVKAFYQSPHYAAQCARVDALLDLTAMEALWKIFAKNIVTFPFLQQRDFRYYGRNNQFEYFDASILSGLIHLLNPKRVVEIGAGFSSAALFDTVDRMKTPALTRFTTIDPDLSRIEKLSPPPMAELIAAPVQTIPVAFFAELEPGDILFIDSSHVLKTGSDVHYEFLNILPALKSGVIVHVHDVFYPFEYPQGWAGRENRSWNEAYLVDMLVTHGRAFDILFFNDAFLKGPAEGLRKKGDMFDRFDGFDTRPWHHVNGSIWLAKR
jgi:hypothetical protein